MSQSSQSIVDSIIPPLKRKLEDCDSNEDDLIFVRMKKDELTVVNSDYHHLRTPITTTTSSRVSDTHSASSSSSSSSTSSSSSSGCSRRSLHFFVRMMSGGNTIVIHANSDDSVVSVHEQIRKITGIPIIEQRLIYRGKQLQWEQSLAECSVQNDAGLQLVGRMRSTEYPKTWRIVNDLVSSVCRLCREESKNLQRIVFSRLIEFLKMIPENEEDISAGHLQVFKSAGAPTALVMLLLCPIAVNRECAKELIKLFLNLERCPDVEPLPKHIQHQCVPIVLEFCKLLSKTDRNVSGVEALFVSCRNTLGSLFSSIGIDRWRCFFNAKASVVIEELYPFVDELSHRLCISMKSNFRDMPNEKLTGDVRDFSAFLIPLRGAIQDEVGGMSRIPIALNDTSPCYLPEIGMLLKNFLDMLNVINECLKELVTVLEAKDGPKEELESYRERLSEYLSIMKELNNISKLYQGAEEKLCEVMRLRRFTLNPLVRYAKRENDNSWLLMHKDVTDFESRRHLVMMMLPDGKDDYEVLHEMLIDRSNLLSESFEYIGRAAPDSLKSGLFMEFKNEEATGPGVLREWFYLVCQAIFDPQHPLFLSCPKDRRRFFPNPASYVEPLHLDYFRFAGRVIALALMHKVQVGVVFDRLFFLQLAGNLVSLEDVHDADPCLYMSCKQILEMDEELVDSDALGLTFVREVEESGFRRVVQLCPGGKDIVLNSRNREEYVKLLIHHCFVASISQQVANFAQGFADILCNPSIQNLKFFFQSLDLEDLDQMLYGSDRAICLNDWQAHTDYNGYKEGDRQIYWFWKIVETMNVDQQRVLLFFWTSVKYLPIEGFGGLQSRLYLYKASGSHDRLPTSHTCFYRLCLPPYPSIAAMRGALLTITQEHVSCSFGNW